MSPMKNPKFSVAASSTKKPNMTFSRFTPLPSVRVAGALSPMFGVIKLSPDSLDRDPTPQRVGGRVSRVIAASLRGARVRLRRAIASWLLRFSSDPRGLLGTPPAARADRSGEPRAVPQRLTGRRGRGHLRGALLCGRGRPLPYRFGYP